MVKHRCSGSCEAGPEVRWLQVDHISRCETQSWTQWDGPQIFVEHHNLKENPRLKTKNMNHQKKEAKMQLEPIPLIEDGLP